MRFGQEYFPATVNSAWAHSAEHIPWSACFWYGLKEQKSLWHLTGTHKLPRESSFPMIKERFPFRVLKCIFIRMYMYVCIYPCEASLFISMYMYICICMYIYIPVWSFSFWGTFSAWPGVVHSVSQMSLYLINCPLGSWPSSSHVSMVSLTQSRVLRRQSQWGIA